MTVDDAVSVIDCALKRPCFQATAESQRALDTLLLAAQVQAALVEQIHSAKVEVEDGQLVVSLRGGWAEGKKMIAKVDEIIDNARGVKVKVRLISL
jgi:hypothetical protein